MVFVFALKYLYKFEEIFTQKIIYSKNTHSKITSKITSNEKKRKLETRTDTDEPRVVEYIFIKKIKTKRYGKLNEEHYIFKKKFLAEKIALLGHHSGQNLLVQSQ